MRKLLFLLIVFLPATGWSANFHYALDVQINTHERKITGTARIKAYTDIKIGLCVRNLHELKVDGVANVTAADDNINLSVPGGKEIIISYKALFNQKGTNFIDKENVFLVDNWYPHPNVLVEYDLTVTLPENFIATSESESVTIQKHGKTKTFDFKFNHPLDSLHLAASTRYVLQKDRYNNISIESYFFKEDAQLADTYIAYTKKYLAMYENMLTSYPYKRFAIVENIFPTGYSMPTFSLLGKQVVNLPFIVKTSLGHEILHQWFGNSIYIDFTFGNWAEGITTYFADYHYAALDGKDTAYRKQILVDYDAYVNAGNAISVCDFFSRRNKAQSTIGYGKSAMFFHGLRELYGEDSFFAAIREFIYENSFRKASWHDIQRAFEKVTGKKLNTYFGYWLSRKDIPRLEVKNAKLRVEQGQIKLNFELLQKGEVYPLIIPVSLYTDTGENMQFIHVNKSQEKVSLFMDEMPNKAVIDENYAIMRHLASEEIPPVLAGIMGKQQLTVVVSSGQRCIYQPIIDALGIENITYVTPGNITFRKIKENSFLIAGYDNTTVNMLFGKQAIPKDGVRIKINKNPYNASECIALLHAKNKTEAQAVQRKIPHYGKYTELAFKNGRNTYKTIVQADNGIPVLLRPAPRVLKPHMLTTVDSIIPCLTASRIIYIGERHDRFAHHINQLQIIKKMHKAGYKLAVGMEMFQKPFQSVVNDYLAGRIDEHTFLEKTEYFSRWRYDYNLYKPIIDYLKQQNLPLVALNIHGDISRKVAREGIYSLSDNENNQLPGSMDFSNERYRRDLKEVFPLHKEQGELKDFSYFLQAQILWDEAMSESAQKFLTDNPESKLVILAGNGHVRHKYGIPERLYRRNHEPFTVVVQDEEIEDGIADYVLITTKLEGEKSPRLGVIVEEKDHDLEVMSISHNSPAKKAGLQEGDVIQMVAGRSIQSLADLKLALFYSKIGSRLKIQIERAGKNLDKEIELFHHSPRKK
ncbi:MAG: ChaN family lipoprotein [Thermodesulfobacteriota bacterium]|nr:ChaN family lipoprotein [Thermodesulfobacteriota bacterium]